MFDEQCAACHGAQGQGGANGLEQIEFRVAGHAGVTLRPLAKVASGGELARISLALAVIAIVATVVVVRRRASTT